MSEKKESDKNAVEFWRNLVKESNDHLPIEQQEKNLAKFDKLAKDPKFIAQLESRGHEQDKCSLENDEGHEL